MVWGGRAFASLLGRELPDDGPFGESWEICDLPEFDSPVADGPLAGTTLSQLVLRHGADLLGAVSPLDGRFPLLFKFIDARDTLSVQVHPDRDACLRLGADARPKTEAWFIIDCAPGAFLYAGLRQGGTAASFARAIDEGNVEPLLHRVDVAPGDFIFLPAGTVHAIGAGIVLAEVQQTSATTYRVFDWNRPGLDGRPRPLHVEQAMQAIHFNEWGRPPMKVPRSGRPGVQCDDFEMEYLVLQGGNTVRISEKGPVVVMGIAGAFALRAGDERRRLPRGDTLMVPACRGDDVQLIAEESAACLVVRFREE